MSGHWGELIQGRLGPDGPVALVTLACPLVRAEAWFAPAPGAPLLVSGAGGGRIAAAAARRTLAALEHASLGGRLVVDCAAPRGIGAGSSTLSALGAVRAVSRGLGVALCPAREAALCLEVEGASDPLMLAAPMTRLWASRLGRALAMLPPPPPMRVLGGVAGPGADTDPADQDFADFADLAALYAEGAAAGDLARVGRAATLSAQRNQARRPTPGWDLIVDAAREAGAAGVAVAHTGSAVALLFAPEIAAARRRVAEQALAAAGVAAPRWFDPAYSGVSSRVYSGVSSDVSCCSRGGVRLTKWPFTPCGHCRYATTPVSLLA